MENSTKSVVHRLSDPLKLIGPFQKFVEQESIAGLFLIVMAIIAMIWANSPFYPEYEALWNTPLGVHVGDFHFVKPLLFWINDGLMTVFFFYIGLELKRELIVGDINTPRKALFPFIAALGGAVVPIFLYLTLNDNPETVRGWAVPMATDVAFALGVLYMLGNRVPVSLKVFLTAFAIIDDLFAVLVIAVFYGGHEIDGRLLLYAMVLISLLGVINNMFRYSTLVGFAIAVVVWYLFYRAGIHPTVAGVILAFTIPMRRKVNLRTLSIYLNDISQKILNKLDDNEQRLLTKEEINCIQNIENLTYDVRSPLQFLEYRLHRFISYGILPLFALANAGVHIDSIANVNMAMIGVIVVSLVVGKFVGILSFSWLGLKLGITTLPGHMKFHHMVGVSAIAGIGFTMSIFIAILAFGSESVYLNSAKLGVVLGSTIAGIIGYTILRVYGDKEGLPQEAVEEFEVVQVHGCAKPQDK